MTQRNLLDSTIWFMVTVTESIVTLTICLVKLITRLYIEHKRKANEPPGGWNRSP